MSNTLQDIKEEDDAEYLQEVSLLGGGQQTQSGSTPNTPNGSGQKSQGPTQQVTPPSQSSLLSVFGAVDVETQDVRKTGGEIGLGLSLQQDKEDIGEIMPEPAEPRQTVYMNGEEVLLPPLPDVSGVAGSVFEQPIAEQVAGVAKTNGLTSGLDYDVVTGDMLTMNSGGLIDTPHLVTPLALNSSTFVNEAPPSVIVGGSLSTDPDNSFDLSKALEIPNNDHNNSNNTSSNIALPAVELDAAPSAPLQNPISPLVSAPMTSLKRKISFSFNPNASSAEAPGLVPPQAVVIQQTDSALHKTSTKSSSSNSRSNSISGRSSSNMAHNILLPMLNTTLETAQDKLHHSIIMDSSKRSPRKFSVESHNSSSASVLNTGMNNSSNNSSGSNCNFDRTSNSASSSVNALGNGNVSGSSNGTSAPGDDLIYKPHSWLSMGCRTKSNLPDGPNTNGEIPNDYANERTTPLSTKKEPLLRRASSVILRKTSLKRDSSATPSYVPSSPQLGQFQEFRSMSECSMQERISPVRATRSRKKLFLRSGVPPLSDYDSNGSVNSSNILLSTSSLRSVTSPLPSLASPRDNSAPPSFGSKVKKGFSRIISGHSKRVPAHHSERPISTSSPNPQEVNLGSMYRGLAAESCSDSPNGKDILSRTRSERGDYRISIDSMSTSPSALRRSHSVNARDLFTSASNSSIGRGQPSVLKRRNTLTSNTSTMAPSIQKRNSSFASSIALTNSGGLHPPLQPTNPEEVEITVDVDELTVSLPTITITEDITAKNTTPIQTQSNISLDCSYSKSLGSHNNVATKKLQKPSRITLKEYIAILMNQQMVEDERFAVLDKMFTSSGWCSHDDVLNLRHKRVMINKKWAERISYYQNKLES